MVVSLEEMKSYLHIDYDDDDGYLFDSIKASEKLCADIARLTPEEFEKQSISKISVMYSVAYMYEHREDADHNQLVLSLRSLLSGIRQEEF